MSFYFYVLFQFTCLLLLFYFCQRYFYRPPYGVWREGYVFSISVFPQGGGLPVVQNFVTRYPTVLVREGGTCSSEFCHQMSHCSGCGGCPEFFQFFFFKFFFQLCFEGWGERGWGPEMLFSKFSNFFWGGLDFTLLEYPPPPVLPKNKFWNFCLFVFLQKKIFFLFFSQFFFFK